MGVGSVQFGGAVGRNGVVQAVCISRSVSVRGTETDLQPTNSSRSCRSWYGKE